MPTFGKRGGEKEKANRASQGLTSLIGCVPKKAIQKLSGGKKKNFTVRAKDGRLGRLSTKRQTRVGGKGNDEKGGGRRNKGLPGDLIRSPTGPAPKQNANEIGVVKVD